MIKRLLFSDVKVSKRGWPIVTLEDRVLQYVCTFPIFFFMLKWSFLPFSSLLLVSLHKNAHSVVISARAPVLFDTSVPHSRTFNVPMLQLLHQFFHQCFVLHVSFNSSDPRSGSVLIKRSVVQQRPYMTKILEMDILRCVIRILYIVYLNGEAGYKILSLSGWK